MQKELIQQKIIQKQNKQQNTDVLTKTAPVMMQKERTDAEFDKLLRRPRSKKKLKLYSEVDLPSMTDEEIMERMRKEKRSEMGDGSLWEESAQEDITQEDIEAFLQSRQEDFIKMIQSEVREEEERIRKEEEERARKEEEERARKEEEERARKNRKTGVLSKCFITGCFVHLLPYAGAGVSWGNVIHFKRWEVPEEFQQAVSLYESCKHCNCVEIYGNRLVAIADSGEVIKIEKL